MKKMMSAALVALFVAGSSAFACSGCGCSAKKSESKTECSAKKECSGEKKASSDCAKSCSSEKKSCSAKK